MSAVAVIAKVPAAPGKRSELAAALQVALDNVEQEAGTRYYILHEDSKDEDVLWMYELYEAQSDLEAHMGAPWFAELGPNMAPLLGGRPELTFLNPLGGKGL
ncbi:MAG: putative quinol monooxygenase [Ilumatobacteraceae bacterium]